MTEPDTILPSQFFRHTLATPETRLLLAILEEALNTRQRYLAATDPRSLAVLAEVEAWFLSDDAARLCAFVAICNTLEIEPTWMRGRLGLSGSPRRPPATIVRKRAQGHFAYRRVGGMRHRVTGRAEGMSRAT
jgi:hypothetical protein